MAHTNGIENFWKLLKRGTHGIYHCGNKTSAKNYIDDICYGSIPVNLGDIN